MRVAFGLLLVAATSVCGAAALQCYRYGPAYATSDAANVWLAKREWGELPQGMQGPVTITSEMETEECAPGVDRCYNFLRRDGYGAAGLEGVGSLNLGRSQGGCWAPALLPADSKWSSASCATDLDADAEVRMFCCRTDRCNDHRDFQAQGPAILYWLGNVYTWAVLGLGVLACYSWRRACGSSASKADDSSGSDEDEDEDEE